MIRLWQILVFFVLCGISCSSLEISAFFGKLEWKRTWCGQDNGGDPDVQRLLTCTCVEKQCKLASYYSSLKRSFYECRKCSKTCEDVAGKVSGEENRNLRAIAAANRCHRQAVKVFKLWKKHGKVIVPAQES